MACDMCGAEGALLKAMIEGTQLTVCKGCARYGKVVGRVRADLPKKVKARQAFVKKEEPEKIQIIVSNFQKLIKAAREKKGLTQEELAKQLAEKESVIHNVESGKFKPSITLARKFEKFFSINLVEEYEEEKGYKAQAKKRDVTVGDFIKIKRRKSS